MKPEPYPNRRLMYFKSIHPMLAVISLGRSTVARSYES